MNAENRQPTPPELSTRPYRIAFYGGGIDSAVGQVHRIAAEMDRRFKLVAGCFSRYPQLNQESAQQYLVPKTRTYNDLKILLEKESSQIDAIVILTPTPQHKEDVIQCLQAGLPVICEKALAGSISEAMAIKDVLQKTHGYLAVTYNYSGYPMLRELKAMIEAGRLGKLEQIHVEMPQEGFSRLDKNGNPPQPQEWRLHDGDLPTIALDLGVHLHHTVQFLTGAHPIKVVAINNSFGTFRDIIDNTLCIAQYSNKITCNIWYSKSALGYRNGFRVRVFGEIGSAEWHQMEPETLHFYDNQGARISLDRASIDVAISTQERYNRFKAGHPSGFIEAFSNLYCDIADQIAQHKMGHPNTPEGYVCGIETAIEGLQLLTAMKDSAESETWITLS